MSRQITLGSLEFRQSDFRAWQAAPLEAAVASFPEDESNYVVADFAGDPEARGRLMELIKQSGARVLQELPEGVVIHTTRATVGQIAAARAQNLVDFVAPIRPKDKLSDFLRKSVNALEDGELPGPLGPKLEPDEEDIRPGLEERLRRPAGAPAGNAIGVAGLDPIVPIRDETPEQTQVAIYLFRGQSTEPVVAQVHELGGKVLGAGQGEDLSLVRAQMPVARLTQIAEMPEIREIVPDAKPTLRNDVARLILNRNPPDFTPPIRGHGQVVGHADSGLDIGVNDHTLHPAFRGRVKKAFPLGRSATSDWSDFDGHGTHTAGSILGSGEFAGPAPEAQLVHQAVGDAEGGLMGIPDPLSKLFQQAYDEGARVHSNSWGIPIRDFPFLKGQYLRGLEVDTWSWNDGQPRDMLIVFAAGNDGSEGNGSVGSPATAKNALVVGASENLRPKAGPLADDRSQLATFSSLGPTDNGRVRPDVVAPGTFIASARTQGERIAFEDDIEDATGWIADQAFTLSSDQALHGDRSWYLSRTDGETYRDFLYSPAFSLPEDIPQNVEVWVRGKVEPAEALLLAIQAGNSAPRLLRGPDRVVGERSFDDWTVLTCQIPPSFLGKDNLRLLFAFVQDAAAQGEIDLHLDRVKVTTFASWAPLSTIDLAPPLEGDDIHYTLSGGTSMAAPLVAGCAALVRQSLIVGRTPVPSAELVKAILINSADAHSGPRPNNRAGWGLVNLRRALTSTSLFDDETALAEGESISYTIQVTDSAPELRTTLVWADPPGNQLQNNLNMVLITPNGEEILPVDGQGVSPDSTNNVEGIDIPSPEVGAWTLTVQADRITQGPQPFALVVSGGIAIADGEDEDVESE
ncbi:S8 family serine peptidase [Tautonia marina]|uniref:S8 family serine peptidase n=1 Tax=Tautonia marina TaxID=2653855 RepID=UPI0013758EF6|nr:S8 family serine peptidase [Tautonia marina]